MAEVTDSAAVAAAALANGNVAALPTETVYGLGARIDDPAAIARIFAIKGRPVDHPLIVHVAPDADLSNWANAIPATAQALVDAFWPGPLTIVVPKSANLPLSVTGGQDTVALRAPANAKFQAVLQAVSQATGAPAAIAAPSANLFGQVSPTTAQHVAHGLGDRLGQADVILDGGPCNIGVESTIVLCHDESVEVLRPGGITEVDLASVVTVATGAGVSKAGASSPTVAATQPRVSGSLEAHYSPRAQVIAVEPDADLAAAVALLSQSGSSVASDDLMSVESGAATSFDTGVGSGAEVRARIGLLALRDAVAASSLANLAELDDLTELALPSDLAAYAAQLYAALRTADELELTTVIAVLPPAEGIGVAIRDRLSRAARG